jgi:hypothetical protein
MLKYMKCLRENEMSNTTCRPQAKDYFQCRMEQWATFSHMNTIVIIIGTYQIVICRLYVASIGHNEQIFWSFITVINNPFFTPCSNLMKAEDWNKLGFSDLEQNKEEKTWSKQYAQQDIIDC